MNGGFSFNGVDIDSLNLVYVPTASNMHVFNPTQKTLHEQSFDGHNGGYFYGTTNKIKTFTLRCYYENTKPSDGLMTKLNYIFKEGTTGKLIFKERDWCYYIATVADLDFSNVYNYLNGVITIKFNVYYPFARSDKRYHINSNPTTVKDEYMNVNTAYMNNSSYGQDLECVSEGDTITSETSFVMFNPGTERACTVVEIAGESEKGIKIYNSATKQTLQFTPFSQNLINQESQSTITGSNTSVQEPNTNGYIVNDSLNGKTIIIKGSIKKNAYLYHDKGFIDLESAYPCVRNLHLNYVSTNTHALQSEEELFTEDMVGKYIVSSNHSGIATDDSYYAKIISVESSNKVITDKTFASNLSFIGSVMLGNEITVSPVSTMSLTKLNIKFKPTFS